MLCSAPRVLVVGYGLTGAATHYFLTKLCPLLAVHIWEKEGDAGGRMRVATATNDTSRTDVVDMGAQYFTRDILGAHSAPISELYDELLHEGVLMEFSGTIDCDPQGPRTHYIAPGGTRSVVEWLGRGCSARFAKTVSRMDQEDSQWKVIAEDGSHEFFDAVVLTIPPPMALSLQGTVAERIAPLRPTFDSLQYSTRYAVAAFYGDEGWDALDSAGGAWCSKYVDHDDVLRYVSVETRKRLGGQATPMERQHGGPALLLHSTVPFGLRASPSEALASMMASLPRVVPTLESVEPKHTQLTHWMLSQVRAPLEGGPFLDVPPLSGSGPTLLLAGDAYTGSHFEGCICSAHAAASHLAALQCS